MIFIGLDKFDIFFFFGSYVSVIQIGWITIGFTKRKFLFWFRNATEKLEEDKRRRDEE